MKIGLMPSAKKGDHFELALRAIRQIRKSKLTLKADTERAHEINLVANLEASSKLKPHVINQIFKKSEDRISKITAFGFDHGPDMAIDRDGTAIEVKVIKSGTDLRACIGQALIYRLGYRFAIMVLVDRTKDGKLGESLRSRASKESKMLRELCDDLNVFSIVGPVGPNNSNLAFFPKSSARKNGEGQVASSLPPVAPELQSIPI